MKKWFKNKKTWIGIAGVFVLLALGVFSACQAGYCKAESVKPKEVIKVVHKETPERIDIHFETDTFFAEMESHFDQMWKVFDKSFPRIHITHHNRGPRVDMIDKKDVLEIIAEFPGVKKEDIIVSVDENYLILETKKGNKKEGKKKDYYLRERRYGASKRILRLPTNINIDKAESSFRNGVLTIIFPRKEKVERPLQKIEIK